MKTSGHVAVLRALMPPLAAAILAAGGQRFYDERETHLREQRLIALVDVQVKTQESAAGIVREYEARLQRCRCLGTRER